MRINTEEELEEDINTIENQIRVILADDPPTRNSDALLTWRLWERYYGINDTVDLEQFMSLPSRDTVKRARAVVQNEEKQFPPTSWEVAKKRHWLEQAWRKALGYGELKQGELSL